MSKSSAPAEPPEQPRTVMRAFFCWLGAAVLTTALGLLLLTARGYLFTQLIGLFLVAVGLGQAFLASRARKGDVRYSRASLALAMATVAFLALFSFTTAVPFIVLLIAITVILLVAGSVLNQLPSSQKWLERMEIERKGAS